MGVVSLEDIIEQILKAEFIDEGDKAKDMRMLASKMITKDLLA